MNENPDVRSLKKAEIIEVPITDHGAGAACFGQLPDGRGVFVEGPVAVGDRVEASIVKIKRNYVVARLIRILVPSQVRIPSPCAHFGVCGGCKWQHVVYAEQLRVKRKVVVDALAHIGGLMEHPVRDPIPSRLEYAYRNKMEFSFGDKRFLNPDELGKEHLAKPKNYALGFHVPGRFDKVVDIDVCHLASPEMNEALALVKAFGRERKLTVYNSRTHEGFLRNLVVRQAFANGELMVYLITSAHDERLMRELDRDLASRLGARLATFVNGVTTRKNTVARGEQDILIRGPGFITERLGNLTFTISPGSFFQTNTLQAMRLYEEVLRAAELTGDEVVHDLYCGTGTISLWMASRCRVVVGCEIESASLRDAEASAKANGIENVRFLALDLKHYACAVRQLQTDLRPDVVVVDPPRAGLHPDLISELRVLRPKRIVYVSCNPATMARDLKMLCADAMYRAGPVQPVDLFPQTAHIECVVRLDRI